MSSRAYFDQVSTQWDEMRSSFFSDGLRQKALDAANPTEGTVAVDLGAGTGFLSVGLLERGVRVIAVDQSQAMLDVLSEKLGGRGELECRRGEAEELPLDEASVDFVFANMYLHHVEDPARAIAEAARVLKPGGVLVITDLDAHGFEFLRSEQNDRWLGFRREDVLGWLDAAGLSDATVSCAGEECSSDSRCCDALARISIFLARGRKG